MGILSGSYAFQNFTKDNWIQPMKKNDRIKELIAYCIYPDIHAELDMLESKTANCLGVLFIPNVAVPLIECTTSCKGNIINS